MYAQSKDVFEGVRDILVNRIVDLGLSGLNNKIGIAFYGTVRVPRSAKQYFCFQI